MKKFFLLLASTGVVFAVSCEGLLGGDPADDNGNGNGGSGVVIHMDSAPSEIELSYESDTTLFFFYATKGDEPAAWKIASPGDWCKVEPAEGTGSSEVKVTVSENTSATPREGVLTISSGKKSVTLPVKQSLYAGALPAESWFTKYYFDRTDREQAGLRGPVKSWYVDTYTTYNKYFYDEQGHLTREEYHNTANNSVSGIWVHTYDAAGHRVSSVCDYGENCARTFTFEYENTGKYVATDATNWIPTLYRSGKEFPLTIWKDLSAIHYVDDSPVYYEKSDYTFVFDADGNLTITTAYQRDRNPEAEKTIENYLVVYADGLPVSCANGGVVNATYAQNGMPISLSDYRGERTYRFVPDAISLLIESFREPKAGGFAPLLWADYSYNSNGDILHRHHAFYSNDQLYDDYYTKYHYDAHGNWVQRIEEIEPAMQHGTHSKSRAGRVIEYY